MQDFEREKIKELKLKGYGYKKIASELNLSKNSVKSYLKRNVDKVEETKIEYANGLCLFCGKDVHQIPHRKIKKFCSDICRYEWHNKHRGKCYG